MDKLPVELLERIIDLVNSSELAAVRRARKRDGRQRPRSMIRNVRLVSRVFARIAGAHLFSKCTILVFPAQDRLREFCMLATNDVAPHVRACVFRADEGLASFPPNRSNVALMNQAASSLRRFVALEHLHIDFLPTQCCRVSGKDWIDQRPQVVARMFVDLDEPEQIFQHLTSVVLHISAEEFMVYNIQFRNAIYPSHYIPRQLRHFSVHINMLSESRYVPRAELGPGGYSTSFHFEPEQRFEDDDAFCDTLLTFLQSFISLHTLDLALLNAELVAPSAFSRVLLGLNYPELKRVALAYAPAYVSALVIFLARHDNSLRLAALFDIDLRADRNPPPMPGKRDVSAGPWLAYCVLLGASPNVRFALSHTEPNVWRTPLVRDEHLAITMLERKLLQRAQEDAGTDADLREQWTYRLTDVTCSRCGHVWPKYQIATSY